MLAAIVVGALTAWYLGLRLGVIIAVVTAAALLVATVVPGLTLTIYALALAWSGALYFFGAKIASASNESNILRGVMGGVGARVSKARSWAKPTKNGRTKR